LWCGVGGFLFCFFYHFAYFTAVANNTNNIIPLLSKQ
jgi:hypothetical protein